MTDRWETIWIGIHWAGKLFMHDIAVHREPQHGRVAAGPIMANDFAGQGNWLPVGGGCGVGTAATPLVWERWWVGRLDATQDASRGVDCYGDLIG